MKGRSKSIQAAGVARPIACRRLPERFYSHLSTEGRARLTSGGPMTHSAASLLSLSKKFDLRIVEEIFLLARWCHHEQGRCINLHGGGSDAHYVSRSQFLCPQQWSSPPLHRSRTPWPSLSCAILEYLHNTTQTSREQKFRRHPCGALRRRAAQCQASGHSSASRAPHRPRPHSSAIL